MAGSLVLVANPGSASRKYALYDGGRLRGSLHLEWQAGKVVCTVQSGDTATHEVPIQLDRLEHAASALPKLLRQQTLLARDERLAGIGVRVVAPGAYFLEDRIMDEACLAQLEAALPRAPLHIAATLAELRAVRRQFPDVPLAGVSDSAFHITKPDYAWNYGIRLEDADELDIKRFGYHGLSAASVVHQLRQAEKLPPKIIICHLGSGASVTAVHGGRGIDTTMGYSPLEGVIMSTRSGSIDPTAVRALADARHLDAAAAETYLNQHGGLAGLGGSPDIRELLQREANGDHRARLALNTYVFSVQKAVGSMAAALGGADALVFTGTVGERSAPIRRSVVSRLHYLDFILDEHINTACSAPPQLAVIGRLAHSKPVYVLPAHEGAEMARRTRQLLAL